MTKLTLIATLTATLITTSSADMGFGGIMTDMMDIPKEIITSGTDSMREMKDAATDSIDEIKDSATDIKDSASDKKNEVSTTVNEVATPTVEPKVSVSEELSEANRSK